MNSKSDIREFLISRRANITPEEAGIADVGGPRRVPGLRRKEVAKLAGVSLDYYIRLERGNIQGASASVLNAISRALHLSDAEHEYLLDLAKRTSGPQSQQQHGTEASTIRTSVQRVLDNMAVPAIVHNACQDLIAANLMGRALYSPMFNDDGIGNIARFIFLDSRSRSFFVDWNTACETEAAILRLETGRDPLNRDLTALIGELSVGSQRFREDWAKQDVHEHRTGVKSFRHPEVGLIEVAFDVFEMPNEAGLQIVTYSAPPNTETAEKFALLESWEASKSLSTVNAVSASAPEHSTDIQSSPKTTSCTD
ncbi:helix-turn-helix transcriptional regulator [Bifidobacterium crudilactis]|jgi:transcriptional regulator with XRE-family HTH domain|uniref:Helix-turn-helix domain-containing protein n=1 Tax=Bifidobacterium crudilactis TaxID=327277 RepID=A0A971CYN3_9BIFI|nr:helix-turn-helix transcriptional regulator [Bifidobacterium crudilactis]MDN5972382.1 helix-turn-helix transcriptional regulator [Bifidobacterium crudilactis]MDN6000467.1 helix-turn-helix transcriptional regulator [Bifidobacterium crudilactis]MDN6208755.1 helix-turn-helix transcriptional regulator [Bifidobacterium crudilactis]MDN6271277.1 helix-turn-helix transcriptional regulator [Bifidobacterium crudilactis]MDN6467389.1 helix-turn-helix transcriptional regulator [Bifidobacterium crudilacti